MTENIVCEQTLKEKLNAIQESIPEGKWVDFHLQAIGNFIYHLSNLSSERTQQRVAQQIDDYLTMVNEKASSEHDLFAVGKELTPHFLKISHAYRLDLGFVGKPFYPFHVIFWMILFFVFRSAFSTTIALIVVAAVCASTIIYYQLKIRARKYY